MIPRVEVNPHSSEKLVKLASLKVDIGFFPVFPEIRLYEEMKIKMGVKEFSSVEEEIGFFFLSSSFKRA